MTGSEGCKLTTFEVIQENINDLHSKIKRNCLCDNCCYWRTKCNTWLNVYYKLKIDEPISIPDYSINAHKNGIRS